MHNTKQSKISLWMTLLKSTLLDQVLSNFINWACWTTSLGNKWKIVDFTCIKNFDSALYPLHHNSLLNIGLDNYPMTLCFKLPWAKRVLQPQGQKHRACQGSQAEAWPTLGVSSWCAPGCSTSIWIWFVHCKTK